ncbi:MAG TPA: hypothetical protein VGC57_07215 [Cellulomonas sp.]
MTTSPASVSRVGQPVVYTFLVRNQGSRPAADLVVRAPFPGLSALVCAPTQLGGTLAGGATTTCRATRRTTATELEAGAIDDTARADARSGTTVLSVASRVRVAVRTAAPVTTDDSLSVVDKGPAVVFEAGANDRPATTGGPVIDPGRTVLVDPGTGKAVKNLRLRSGVWTVRSDGRVERTPNPSFPDVGGTVVYRVVDVAGRSATGRLNVSVLRHADAVADEVSTRQATPVTFGVLGNDDPGAGPNGAAATLDPRSVRLTDGPGYAVLAPDGRTMRVPYAGTYVVSGTGQVTFTPLPTFRGTSDVRYTATSSNTSTVLGFVQVTIERVTPKPGNQRRVTRYGHDISFAGARDAVPGAGSVPIRASETRLVASGAEADGKRYVTRAGTWSVADDGSVGFVPAAGYSGTTAVTYEVGDADGTRASATLTATVRPGTRTALVQGSTRSGAGVTLQPLTRATPGQQLDGSPAVLRRSSLGFPSTAGLPTGSSLGDDGQTLTVPGQGVWRADRAAGSVRFTPERSFAGLTSRVTWRAYDDEGTAVDGQLVVAVVGSAPVATDDLASTPATAPVVLPGATNDSAAAAALRPALTVFAADGQPAGSSRAPDGKTVAVPGQGTWGLSSDGSATFSPASTFVGTTAPVGYQVTDAAGAVSRASLRVVVQAGPAAREDTVRLGLAPSSEVAVRPLENDLPGLDADSSPGTTLRTSLRLARTGQAAGWTVRADGLSAEHRSGVVVDVGPVPGQVSVRRGYVPAAVTLPLVYTVVTQATGAAGNEVRATVSSTIRIEVPVAPPAATDDHAATISPWPVGLLGPLNDLPGDSTVPISDDGLRTTFPTSQLAQLPAGSTIVDGYTSDDPYGYHPMLLTVPGEGQWSRLPAENGYIVFVPDPDFVGETTPVVYRGADVNGSPVEGVLRVTVQPRAAVHDDVARTSQGVDTAVDVLANDDPGVDADGTPAEPARTGVQIDNVGLPKGATLVGNAVTVPGQGRYLVDPLTERVVFRPDPGFTGPGIRLSLTVSASVAPYPGEQEHGDREETSFLQVVVDPVTPVARPDTATTAVGQPVVVPVLTDDAAGVSAVPLVGSSVRLRLSPDLPTGSALAGDAKSLTVPGRGVFLVSGQGEITFVPLGTATGAVPTVGYQVADTNTTTARSTLSVTVR